MATAPQDSVIYANLRNNTAFTPLEGISAEQWENIDTIFRKVCDDSGIDALDVNQVWALACGLILASSYGFSPLAGLYVVNKAVTMVEHNSPKPSSL